MKSPTERQLEARAQIESFIAEHGYPPTTRELGELLGIAHGRVSDLLLRMEESGLVELGRGARTIRLTPGIVTVGMLTKGMVACARGHEVLHAAGAECPLCEAEDRQRLRVPLRASEHGGGVGAIVDVDGERRRVAEVRRERGLSRRTVDYRRAHGATWKQALEPVRRPRA